MINIFFKFTSIFETIVFPRYCPICGYEYQNQRGWMCDECWENLPPAGSSLWKKEEKLKNRCWAIFNYNDTARRLVHQMKFFGRKDIAERLGIESAIRFKDIVDISLFSSLTPVPLHPARVRERGYDQNLVLTKAMSDKLNIPLKTDIIYRIKHRPPQSRLSNDERRLNLKEAFAPNLKLHSKDKGALLLVDDVIHTGATALNCIEALNKAGISKIYILAACG